MISAAYAVQVCCLLGLALVPTVIHSYWDEREDDGRRSAAIDQTLSGYTGVPSSRGATWGSRRFDSGDWIERVYRRPGEQVRLTVVRSYDLKSLYHHPELAVAYGTAFVGHQVRRLKVRPEIPVFELEPGPGVRASAFYVLFYGDQFVEAPIRFQLRTAGELLFSPRRAMTLFFVFDPSAADRSNIRDAGDTRAVRVLLAAIDSFLEQLPPPDHQLR